MYSVFLNKKAFTLIELIIFIIIGAIILPASFVAFTAVFKHFSAPDYVVKARYYADMKFAELTRYPYSDGKLDAIDEKAYTDIPGSYDNVAKKSYSWKWRIQYVDPYNNTNPYFAELAKDTTPIPDYKIITVTVKALDDAEYAFPLLITNRPKK